MLDPNKAYVDKIPRSQLLGSYFVVFIGVVIYVYFRLTSGTISSANSLVFLLIAFIALTLMFGAELYNYLRYATHPLTFSLSAATFYDAKSRHQRAIAWREVREVRLSSGYLHGYKYRAPEVWGSCTFVTDNERLEVRIRSVYASNTGKELFAFLSPILTQFGIPLSLNDPCLCFVDAERAVASTGLVESLGQPAITGGTNSLPIKHWLVIVQAIGYACVSSVLFTVLFSALVLAGMDGLFPTNRTLIFHVTGIFSLSSIILLSLLLSAFNVHNQAGRSTQLFEDRIVIQWGNGIRDQIEFASLNDVKIVQNLLERISGACRLIFVPSNLLGGSVGSLELNRLTLSGVEISAAKNLQTQLRSHLGGQETTPS